MFQKDYWSMDDRTLADTATKYHIPHIGRAGEHGEHWYMDRDYVITRLVARDAARQTNITVIVSIAAVLISIGSVIVAAIALGR